MGDYRQYGGREVPLAGPIILGVIVFAVALLFLVNGVWLGAAGVFVAGLVIASMFRFG